MLPSGEDIRQLRGLVEGYRVSQAIHVAATLGLADLLTDGPRTADELAHETGAHAHSLFRMLRFLAGVGLFQEVGPRQFALTPLGAGLRTDVPRTVQPMAAQVVRDVIWQAWGNLGHSVRTGETAFNHTHGMGNFTYFATHPDIAATFNRYMTSNTADSGNAINEAYDFAGIERIVDVGGGHGQMIATILAAHPSMRGVLFDRPAVVAGARPILEEAGVADRCEIVGGSFFEALPRDADAYVLRQIIHDWDDADSIRILTQIREAMKSAGRVLIVERAIRADYRCSLPTLHTDMHMMVVAGGIQRTDDEHRALLEAAGFTMTRLVPLNDLADYAVTEGRPA